MVIVRFNQWEEFLNELKVNSPEDRTIFDNFRTTWN